MLDRLVALKGVRYRFVDGKGSADPHVGLLAQELQAVFPVLVRQTRRGELSVAYGA